MIVIMVVVTISGQVVGANFVSAAEALAIRLPLLARDMGMAELIAIVHVKPAVVVEVFPSPLDSVAEPLVLDLWQV